MVVAAKAPFWIIALPVIVDPVVVFASDAIPPAPAKTVNVKFTPLLVMVIFCVENTRFPVTVAAVDVAGLIPCVVLESK